MCSNATYLWSVACDLAIDRCEHASGFAAWHSQIDANVCLQSHACTLQRRVDSQVDRIVAFTGVVFVNDGAMVCDLVPSGPPTYPKATKNERYQFRDAIGLWLAVPPTK